MSEPEVISLGCRMNIAESERMKAMLAEAGDVVVVNSCAVTSEAVRQTRQAIRKARRARPDARLIVTGCAADIERDALADMPEVDGLIANESKLDPRSWNVPLPEAPPPPTRTRAFIAIQNGCDHACTFCVIPQGRGRSRSMPISDVLREVEHHLSMGAKEVVLTGVDVTSWGLEGDFAPSRGGPKPTLGTLVAAVLHRFPELQRLRMSSVDGIEIDEELFELFAFEQRMMPHLHLSMQHGHDLILKRMKRRHSRAQAIDLVQKLKQHRPDLAIGADLIAGFPTETDAHHADNLSIIQELGIVHGHIFPYSPRPGTPAARMPQVDRTVVKARAAQLREATGQIREKWLENQVGKAHKVLVERDGTGYTEHYARVAVPDGVEPGTIATITPRAIEGGLLR